MEWSHTRKPILMLLLLIWLTYWARVVLLLTDPLAQISPALCAAVVNLSSPQELATASASLAVLYSLVCDCLLASITRMLRGARRITSAFIIGTSASLSSFCASLKYQTSTLSSYARGSRMARTPLSTRTASARYSDL